MGSGGATHVAKGEREQGVALIALRFSGNIIHCQGGVGKNCIMKTAL